MRAYFSKAKHLPAKTTDFVQFLQRVDRGAISGLPEPFAIKRPLIPEFNLTGRATHLRICNVLPR